MVIVRTSFMQNSFFMKIRDTSFCHITREVIFSVFETRFQMSLFSAQLDHNMIISNWKGLIKNADVS